MREDRRSRLGYEPDTAGNGSGSGGNSRGLSAQILADNQRMLALARASGLKIELERDGETCELVMAFAVPGPPGAAAR